MGNSLEIWEKLLPNQSFNSDLYSEETPLEQNLYETIIRTSNIKPPRELFAIENSDLFTIEEMASSPAVLGLLDWLIKILAARKILEIGTFVGVSTMYMASAIAQDGKVTTLEKFNKFAEIALRNFENNDLSDKIELILGDALETIPSVEKNGPFDVIFIDGNKENYATFFELTTPFLAERGVVIIDDAIFHGDVLNSEPQSEKGQGVKNMLEKAEAENGWNKILLPISNGMLFMSRK